MNEKKGFTTGEVASLCHVTIPTVIKWIESGNLEGFKIPHSKNRRVTRESLLKFMKKHDIPMESLSQKVKIRILVVESDPETLRSLEALLNPEKYEVKMVAKGFEAGISKEFKPEIVILALDLSDIKGDQVCRFLREMPEMKHSSIMAMGSGAQENSPAFLKNEFDDYLRKPFEGPDVLEKIKRLVSKMARRKKRG